MFKFFSKCEICGKLAPVIMKRTFEVIPVGTITTKSYSCRHCYKEMKNKLDNINKQLQ